MTDEETPTAPDESNDEPAEDDGCRGLDVSRRSVMQTAATAGIVSGGFSAVAAAQTGEDCADVDGPCDDCGDTGCSAQQGDCTPCLGGGCEELAGTRLEAGTDFSNDLQCVTLSDAEIPDDADRAVIKAANNCHECEVVDTSGQTFCIDGKHDISHIEFAECPSADITVDCANDHAEVAVELTDSVYYEVDYVHCDEADFSGTLTGSGDAWSDTVTLADCEGTITVWLSSDKAFRLDSAQFDCETASVSVDCANDVATISAPDTSEVWYAVDYEHCDEADVARTGPVDLSSTDSVTVHIANCEGTITVTDDDERTLASAAFDCETASVGVDCASSEATISSGDSSELWYEIDYEHCDEADVSRTGPLDLSGSTDSVTVPVANCEGTIVVTDDDDRELDSADFDCETASIAEVDCPNGVARVHAEDTATVYYEVDYVHCDESGASGPLDFSSTDDLTIPLANCEGTITLTDDDGRELDSQHFDCETATVEVDCSSSTATISANDTSEMWYEIDYDHCDEADVSRKGPLDLSGDTDSVTVPVANCEGTITLTDDDGIQLDSADFDCETASIAEVDCPNDVARIHAEDTSTVNYAVDYVHCDAVDASGTLDFSSKDDLTVPLANCEGTITLTDDDGRELDSQHFDCETASVNVDCANDVANVHAEDTASVNYAVDYVHCDEADASGTLDFSTTDDLTVGIADCEGTITLTDDDGRELDWADFDCETASVSVACPSGADGPVATISADDTASVGYSVTYDGDCTDDSGSVDLSGSTDSVEVPLENCGGTITVSDDDGRELDATTFERCCEPCPSGLEMKFEGGEIEEGNAKTYGDVTFTITDVTTKSGGDDIIGICFDADPSLCTPTLELTVKTGEFEETADVSAEAGEYCFDVDDGEGPFEDENDPVQGVSHFTIRCP